MENARTRLIKEILRVNFSGETMALGLYAGQISVVTKKSFSNTFAQKDLIKILHHMHLQEKRHYIFFKKTLQSAGYRGSKLNGLWKKLGFFLGWLSMKCGISWAMCLTSAIEEIVHRHYANQQNQLKMLILSDKKKLSPKALNVLELLLQKIHKRKILPFLTNFLMLDEKKFSNSYETVWINHILQLDLLKKWLYKFELEEKEHHHCAGNYFIPTTTWQKFIHKTIKRFTKCAIFIGKKI